MRELSEHRLGEFVEIQTGPFGSQLHAHDYVVSGTPMVMPTNIGQRLDIVLDEIAYVSDSDISRLERYLVKQGDIVYSRRGDVEKCAYITEKQNGWLCGGGCLRIRVSSCSLDSKFLAYYLSTRESKSWILNSTVGSTMPNLNSSILLDFPLRVPPIDEQRAIAEVLSSLDDKIDLLHRQNKTVESLAETLFRQLYLLSDERGTWGLIKLTDVFDFLEGPGIRNWQYTETGTRFINIRLIDEGDIDLTRSNFVSDDEANGKYKHFLLEENDLIVSTSGTLGKKAIVRNHHLPLMLNTSVIRFRPRDGVNYSFMYQYLGSAEFLESLESMASGSVQLNFGPVHLKQISLSYPPERVLSQLRTALDPLYEKMKENLCQIRCLSQIRDSLLPKLVNGEIQAKYE